MIAILHTCASTAIQVDSAQLPATCPVPAFPPYRQDMAHPNVVQTYAVRCALFTPDFAAALAAAKSADNLLARQALIEEAAVQAHAVAEMRAGVAGVQGGSRTPLQPFAPWSGSGIAGASGSAGAGMGKGVGIALRSVFSTGGSSVEDEGGGGGGSNACHAVEGVKVQGRLPALERLKSTKGAGGSGGSSRGAGGSVDLLGTQALMEAAGAFAGRGISQRPRSANVLLGSMQVCVRVVAVWGWRGGEGGLEVAWRVWGGGK